MGQRDHSRRCDRPVEPDDHLARAGAGLRPAFVVLERAVSRRARFAVENVLEELDRPGEWCLDSEEGKLYFWPPKGSIEGLEVVAPKLDRLVALERTSYVTLRGFTLTETIDGDDLHPDSVEGLGRRCSRCRGRSIAARRST